MSEKKHIDKLFKEQLKNFEVAPQDAVWENIERELHQKRKKRRVIPIWWKVAGIAAVLALLFTVGKVLWTNNTNNQENLEVVDTEKANDKSINDLNNSSNTSNEDTTPEDTYNNTVVDYDTSEKANDKHSENNLNTTSEDEHTNSSIATSKQKKDKSSIHPKKSQQKEAFANTDVQQQKTNTKEKEATVNTTTKNAVTNRSKTDEERNQDDHQNPVKTNKTEIDKLIKTLKDSETTKVTSSDNSEKDKVKQETAIDSAAVKTALTEKNAIEKAMADAENNEDSTLITEAPMKRWSVAPNVAPVYFNTLGKGSSIDDQFVDNTKEGRVNVSYGLKGSYAINEKLKIRAGVNKVDLGYSTNNVLVFDAAGRNPSVSGSAQLGNIRFHDSLSSNNGYVSADNFSFATGPEILFTKEQGSLDQQLGFIEVPIELEYSIIDKTFGLNVIGGFSTLILSNNEVYAVQENGSKTLLGEATNINDMSYSANFGIGVNYNVSKQLQFNLEPMFKYQINTFNNTSGDFKPFFIGVYTGLSFKF
ncbi:hypothetical protein [Psychroserpens sp. SPM9]|uniref:hypothetical protein n=1 Tax=Psychroserpens sp. SPM9 TaxID=2975598 RepID=UPI0021A531F1|nr:hypothetical protein [Psychroserpens sp. SPM9]MDG5491156.1 hypothetical protein [Psychroserpens sp. SPM9]